MAASGLGGKYDLAFDRDSAFEKLQARAEEAAREASEAEAKAAQAKEEEQAYKQGRRYDDQSPWGSTTKAPRSSSRSDSLATTFGKSLARQLGTKTGQALVRGVLGSLFKSR